MLMLSRGRRFSRAMESMCRVRSGFQPGQSIKQPKIDARSPMKHVTPPMKVRATKKHAQPPRNSVGGTRAKVSLNGKVIMCMMYSMAAGL